MAAAILLSTLLLVLCSSANSQNTATLTFSNEHPAENDNVTITCGAEAIVNPTDLSFLAFYASNNDSYRFNLTRNCTTTELSESSAGFEGSVYAIVGDDQKIYLQWTYFPIEFKSMFFQCSITDCTAGETAVSNETAITVLANPQMPNLQPIQPWFEENIVNNLTFNCQGFVGYPGGNLELILHETKNFSETTTTLANFTGDAQGAANGTYVLSLNSSRADDTTRNVSCVAYNTLNPKVPKQTTKSDSFSAAYAPKTIMFKYSAGSDLVEKTNGSLVIDRSSPISSENLTCSYDEAAPAAIVEFTQIDGINSTDKMVYDQNTNTYTIVYSGTGAFTLVFKCTVLYESTADTNIKVNLTELATVNVRAMATTFNVSYLLLLSALAALWKI